MLKNFSLKWFAKFYTLQSTFNSFFDLLLLFCLLHMMEEIDLFIWCICSCLFCRRSFFNRQRLQSMLSALSMEITWTVYNNHKQLSILRNVCRKRQRKHIIHQSIHYMAYTISFFFWSATEKREKIICFNWHTQRLIDLFLWISIRCAFYFVATQSRLEHFVHVSLRE